MSPSERKAKICKDRTDLSLTKQCQLLKISRSSLYYVPVGMDDETLKLMNGIDRVFTNYPFFGSRQIAAYFPRNGFHPGRHRVRRLMGIMGLQAIYRGPTPAKSIPSTGFIHTCCGSCLSHVQTKFGAAISPISRCGAGSCIWWQSWIGRRVRCRHGGCRTRWTPAFMSTH